MAIPFQPCAPRGARPARGALHEEAFVPSSRRSQLSSALEDRERDAAPDAHGARVLSGHLTGVDDEGRLLFQPEGSREAPVPVAIGIELSDGALLKAARQQRRAIAVRTADATARLVLIGLVRERVSTRALQARPGQLEVQVDGETLILRAERDLVLECGESKLSLRKDGKIVISGTNVLSASRGPHRIKGATIALN
jgi:hypothetical protein